MMPLIISDQQWVYLLSTKGRLWRPKSELKDKTSLNEPTLPMLQNVHLMFNI